MRALGFEPKKEEIKKMLSDVDKDGSGQLVCVCVCMVIKFLPSHKIKQQAISVFFCFVS